MWCVHVFAPAGSAFRRKFFYRDGLIVASTASRAAKRSSSISVISELKRTSRNSFHANVLQYQRIRVSKEALTNNLEYFHRAVLFLFRYHTGKLLSRFLHREYYRAGISVRTREFRRIWRNVTKSIYVQYDLTYQNGALACRKAGVLGMLRHDLRRTAVRNLIRSRVVESISMKITEHQTRSAFDRCAIVNDADLKEAARKVSGHNLDTSHEALVTPITVTH